MVFAAWLALECRRQILSREVADLEQLCVASELRSVLAAASPSQSTQESDGADHARRRLVGPGRFLRPGQGLRSFGEDRHESPELSGRRPMEPRRMESRYGRQIGKHRFR